MRYETKEDLAREKRAVEKFVALFKGSYKKLGPNDIDFSNQALIAVSMVSYNTTALDGQIIHSIIDDTFMVTQDLKLMVSNPHNSEPVNWQCRFKPVKMTETEMANANLRQFHVFDE